MPFPLVRCFLLALVLLIPSLGKAAESPKTLARIELYNPTQWTDSTTVKVRCGDIGAPGEIDWRRVRLRHQDADLPWSLCEGAPRWKAELKAPIVDPRAEDLLTFAVPVAAGKTTTVDVVLSADEAQPVSNAINNDNESLRVTYPSLAVTVNRTTGLLTGVEFAGQSILKHPLSAKSLSTTPETIAVTGNMGAWRSIGTARLSMDAEQPPLVAKLHYFSSTDAMSELNFILKGNGHLQVGLTYRIYAAGLVEIYADGLPWEGMSPWLGNAINWEFALDGSPQSLPYLENRWPGFGFKEYFQVVRHPANIYRSGHVSIVELGEEIVNGRRWHRRIYLSNNVDEDAELNLAEIADEGLAITVSPLTESLDSETIIVQPPAEHPVIGQLLVEKLTERGLSAALAGDAGAESKSTITLSITDDPESLGISGDGFQVSRTPETGGVTIVAATPFGLTQAALRAARDTAIRDGHPQIPLTASNPTVDTRAVGPGGGRHEVSFPYGSDEEWIQTFDGLIASGINNVACLGMWSDWKMPVKYKYMPEIYSTAPDAFDEVAGGHLKDVDKHRERGLRLAKYLRDRGVKVWLWVPVGCVPTTFAEKFPEAMCEGSAKTPNFAHPKYNQFLGALVKELLETYPIDGVVMIRDDNGEICRSPDYMEFVKNSRSKDPIWEQYLALYDMLKQHDFDGDIVVYPYNDFYMPRHEDFLPKDLIIAGHGSGFGVLSRDFDRLAPMGDTWLDNMYCLLFALPSAPHMNRLLSDRPSFWTGGDYTGNELPWEAIGYFGWNSEATPNSLRYEWGRRVFGDEHAKQFVRWSDVNEHLWDMLSCSLPPVHWTKLSPPEKAALATEIRSSLKEFSTLLSELKQVAGTGHEPWFQQVGLCPALVKYRLERLENADQIAAVIQSHLESAKPNAPLPAKLRKQLVAEYAAMSKSAEDYHQAIADVPTDMLSQTLTTKMTQPWTGLSEALVGMGWYADIVFHSTGMTGAIELEPLRADPGKPCTLRCRVTNTGFYPWTNDAKPRLVFSKTADKFGIPEEFEIPVSLSVFGDTQVVEIEGVTPQNWSDEELTCTLTFPTKSLGPDQSVAVKLVPVVAP